MSVDLSEASGDGLKLILLRVPAKDLIGKCTQVSKRWKGILEDNDFWRKKMEEDGYLWQGKMCENGNKLEWKNFATLSTKLFKLMALKHCFERNFLKDIWNLHERTITVDPRWKSNGIFQMEEEIEDNRFAYARIEIPPKFAEGYPKTPQAFVKPIAACLAIPRWFSKFIVIKLADEGLSNEIMDNFRPTIFITEMVANRRDRGYTSEYYMQCSLQASSDVDIHDIFRFHMPERELRNERRNENGRWVRVTIGKQFNQWEDEGWHRMVISIKDYPAGMRYLYFRCFSRTPVPGLNQEEITYGLKMANCSMMALLEKNAPAPDNEDEEEYPKRKRIKLMD